MTAEEKQDVEELVRGSFEDAFWSDKIQNLLKQYAKDVISSIKAINEIPKSYFEGVKNIEEEKMSLVNIYTENIMDKLGDSISDELVDRIKDYLRGISA